MTRLVLWVLLAAAALLAGCRQLDCLNAALANPRERCTAAASAPGWEYS